MSKNDANMSALRLAVIEGRVEKMQELAKDIHDGTIRAVLLNTFRTAATHPDEHTAQTLLENLQNHQPKGERRPRFQTHEQRENLADELTRLREETYADKGTEL